MLTRLFSRYVEYRRVGLNRPAAMRFAWMVASTGTIAIIARPPSQSS
jgi:hypothetical protein